MNFRNKFFVDIVAVARGAEGWFVDDENHSPSGSLPPEGPCYPENKGPEAAASSGA